MLKNEYLAELRAVLIDRRQKLVAYRQETRTTWDRIEKSEKDYYDQASLESILAELSQMDERRWSEILQIDTALERIEEGAYGICESCEEFIGIGRMRALPHARMCVHCAQFVERFGAVERAPRVNPSGDDCQELIDKVQEAIEEDGRIASSDLDIACAYEGMVVTGTLSDEREHAVLHQIIEEVAGKDEPVLEIRLINAPPEEGEHDTELSDAE